MGTEGAATTTGMGGATTGSLGAGGTVGAGGAGMGGSGGSSATDFDVTAEDFTCIADWDKVLGFRITNLLGQTAEAVAVAENPSGGTYPVGTIIQHLPTEAMVKRAAGFSPESKDWEFFLLDISSGSTVITERGTTEIQTMGNTCVSCHSLAPDEFDFVCNTWGAQGSENCGFDFGESQLSMAIDNDPRCP